MGLTVESLSKSYPQSIGGRHLALDDVSVDVPTGAFVTLLGPSGCGKSTLLNLIAGLDKPTAGRISIDGRPIVDTAAGRYAPPAERNIAMVFQSYAIWPHMTVRQNVEFPIRHGANRVRDRAELARRADSAMDKVKLADFSERPAPLLSGGQQQRVSLARALAQNPSILLLDEPLSNLDASLRIRMQREIRSIVTSAGMTAVYVTHDQREAMSMSDIIVLLNEGRVEQVGTPREIYARPCTRFAAEFLGSSNLFDASVESVDGTSGQWVARTGVGALRVATQPNRPVAAGERYTLVIKQEDLALLGGRAPDRPGWNRFPMRVASTTFFGGHVEVSCTNGTHQVCVDVSAHDAEPVDEVVIGCAPVAIHYF